MREEIEERLPEVVYMIDRKADSPEKEVIADQIKQKNRPVRDMERFSFKQIFDFHFT